MRIQHRLVRLSLSSMLNRHRKTLVDTSGVRCRLSRPESFVALHGVLARRWKNRVQQSANSTFVALTSFGMVVCSVLNIAGGSCIPMWILALLALNIQYLFTDAIILGVCNANADSIIDLYREAVREIKELIHLVGKPSIVNSADPYALARLDTLASLAENGEILEAFVAGARHRARLFGLVASMGLARTLFVTLLTVLLGLWTILRGAGIRFVVDMACPAS
ncbi:hypothetical protein DFJ74DRAFT_394580 [Hyaloraphidium curvatum]|nr:hypothetical protein DFJ74DRAFT_394580 [Hyaloraphidium curvatum]